MFGVIVAGRLVQTDMEQVGETQFVFNLADADSINHIVLFMTGTTPFPDGMGGAVYFSMPSADGSQSWHLVGHITNQKPSLIFKVSNLKKSDGSQITTLFSAFSAQPHLAQIGISVESLAQLSQQTAAVNTAPSKVSDFMEFSTKMCESFYNYAASFSQTQAQMTPQPQETFVPLSVLQNWFKNFQRKLQHNPNFWKS